MKRLFCFILALLLFVPLLISCGGQTPGEPGDESVPESTGEASKEPDYAWEGNYPTEYVAPEDGSFTICGVPLSEYSILVYYPGTEDFSHFDRKPILDSIQEPIAQATGLELPFSLIKNDRYDNERKEEHEILFGVNFQREGIPEGHPGNYYGVTADGTVYFCGVTPLMFGVLVEQFLEEFFGVVPGSGEQSAGCAVGECYRDIPVFTESALEAMGYTEVLEEPFDGDSLNPDLWEYRYPGPRRGGFQSSSQVAVRDGKLLLTGEYLTDGEYGEGWYGAAVVLRQKYCRGYFEARVKVSLKEYKMHDFGSAFWLQGPDPYNPDKSLGGVGEGGVEIDIMENFGPEYISGGIWVSGYGEEGGLSSYGFTVYSLNCDYTEDFHTFALLWDEEKYEFFVDGLLIMRTSFGNGTATVGEEVILSLETSDTFDIQPGTVRVMEVDSLRIFQKTDS